MKRFKLNFAVIAFMVGSVVAFSQSAFTPVRKAKAQTGTNYKFNGNQLSQDLSASNYSTYSTAPSCDEANVLPCIINVTGDLQTWLNTQTNQSVVDNAIDTRD
ncbi:MAG: hypothetical protein ACHQHN_13835 [Sphingobacteriales bacterium]